jgi:hypothetical protein
VDPYLHAVGSRFVAQQFPDGSWVYPSVNPGFNFGPGSISSSMTCAGLLGLVLEAVSQQQPAVPKGKKAPKKVELLKNPRVQAGLDYLHGVANGKITNSWIEGRKYYFFWSLERVGVIYQLEKPYKGWDWYKWGAGHIVANQMGNGAWVAEFGGGDCDTSFALLFLRKANPYKDLIYEIKGEKPPPTDDPFEFVAPIEKVKGKGTKKKSSSLSVPPALIPGRPDAVQLTRASSVVAPEMVAADLRKRDTVRQ